MIFPCVAEHLRQEAAIAGEVKAQAVGQRQHELAIGHGGQDSVDEVRGAVGHAAGSAARAQPPVARQTEQPLMAGGNTFRVQP